MRKRNQLVASLLMAWSLVGCGGGGGTTSGTTNSDTTSGTVGCTSGYRTSALNMQDGTVKICQGYDINFYDNGGANNDYNNNELYTLTLRPATPGKKISVELDSFDTEQGYDNLKFYNGDSTSADYIGALRNDFSSDPYKSTIITSTAADGSLTIQWYSDGSNAQSGWVGTISEVDSVEYLTMRDSSYTMEADHNVTFYDIGGENAAYDSQKQDGNAGTSFRALTIYPSAPGKKVSVDLDSFDIEQGNDSLRFYNGDSTSADYIGALRNDFASDPYKSTIITSTAADGSLTIELSVDSNIAHTGWVGTISEVDSVEYLTMRDSSYTMEADHNVTFYDIGGENGTYDSQKQDGYAGTPFRTLTIYPSAPGKKVSVELDSFDIEQGNDSLRFYNGDSTSADYIGALRNDFASDPYKSTIITSTAADGSLTIELSVDSNIAHTGWVGTISEVDSVEYLTMRDSNYTMEPDHNVTFYDIGGENAAYDSQKQDGYAGTPFRTLTIYPSAPGKKVSVELDSFDIEGGNDELNFYNGASTLDELLSNLYYDFSTSMTITSTADDGSLTIELSVDSSVAHSGWIGTISEQ